MKPAALTLAAVLAAGLSTASLADDDIVAKRDAAGTKIAFLLKDGFSDAMLTVAGPNEFSGMAFAKHGAIAIDLRQFGPIDDGVFAYQLTAATKEKVAVRTPRDNGRITPPRERTKGASTSGTFRVVDGAIALPEAQKPERRDVPRETLRK